MPSSVKIRGKHGVLETTNPQEANTMGKKETKYDKSDLNEYEEKRDFK